MGQGTVSSGKKTAATVGAAAALGTAAVLVSMNDAARFKELQANLDKLMEECADMAERAVASKRPKDEILNPARCNEAVGQDSEGKPVTRAMQLGNEKHEEALKCIKEKLGAQIQGHFSIEQRYRQDKSARNLELVSPEEERRLVQQGRKHELRGTLKPDVVIHSGNPKQVRLLYDFKFPCVKGSLGTWRLYTRGPYQDTTQGQMYEKAFGVRPGRVLPGKKGVIR
jgi:hypothetical protein